MRQRQSTKGKSIRNSCGSSVTEDSDTSSLSAEIGLTLYSDDELTIGSLPSYVSADSNEKVAQSESCCEITKMPMPFAELDGLFERSRTNNRLTNYSELSAITDTASWFDVSIDCYSTPEVDALLMSDDWLRDSSCYCAYDDVILNQGSPGGEILSSDN